MIEVVILSIREKLQCQTYFYFIEDIKSLIRDKRDVRFSFCNMIGNILVDRIVRKIYKAM